MADVSDLALTNYLDYEFDEVGFDQRFELALIETGQPAALTNWFEQSGVTAIKGLGKRPIDAATSTYSYLVLADKQSTKRIKSRVIKQTRMTLSQARSAGFDSDMVLMLLIKRSWQGRRDDHAKLVNRAATSDLYLVLEPEKSQTLRTAVQVEIKQHILQLKTRTFRASSNDRGFVVSNGCFKYTKSKTQPVFQRHSLNGQKNVTRFLSVQELPQFEKTRVGIIDQIIATVNDQYEMCLKQLLQLRAFPVADYQRPKLSTDEPIVTTLLAEKRLHFLANPAQPVVVAFMKDLVDRAQKSNVLQAHNVTITAGTKPIRGLNLQVVKDLNDPDYLCSDGQHIIQHLTLANFTDFNATTGDYQWRIKADELLKDKKFHMTLAQLMIKWEVITRQLRLPTPEKIAAAARFRYIVINKAKSATKQTLIQATRLTVTPTGQLSFESTTFAADARGATESELSQLAWRIWQAAGSRTSQLLGALQSATQVFLIYGTELMTLPDGNHLRKELIAADGNNRIYQNDLIEAAKGLTLTNAKQARDHVRLMAELSRLNQSTLKVKQVNLQLTLGRQLKVIQALNDQLHERNGIWLYPPVRQKRFAKYWIGTYGMGLLEIRGKSYYFVGNHQPIKDQLAKAIPLKCIEVLDSRQPREDIRNMFQTYESLLQVFFVRLNQYTVIPFPFKYIREYRDLLKHQEKGKTVSKFG
ncbi:hypothetical protein [Levilactobacillus sp. HBUAS70063]|uniref:hypothetical protein n=1 Tax=Levilactobacillus sp. HBUAS70063 TaxID=3109359 RepID=UPI0031330FA8